MTVVEVKALLNETTTTNDDFYEALIPELEAYAREYTNDEDLPFTTSVKLFVAKACQWLSKGNVSGVEEEALGDYRVTYAQASEQVAQSAFPGDVLAFLNTYRRVRWA